MVFGNSPHYETGVDEEFAVLDELNLLGTLLLDGDLGLIETQIDSFRLRVEEVIVLQIIDIQFLIDSGVSLEVPNEQTQQPIHRPPGVFVVTDQVASDDLVGLLGGQHLINDLVLHQFTQHLQGSDLGQLVFVLFEVSLQDQQNILLQFRLALLFGESGVTLFVDLLSTLA
jgi:hypothetical protein